MTLILEMNPGYKKRTFTWKALSIFTFVSVYK
jgi:hypothetical protein